MGPDGDTSVSPERISATTVNVIVISPLVSIAAHGASKPNKIQDVGSEDPVTTYRA
jgi:hypothetical protein